LGGQASTGQLAGKAGMSKTQVRKSLKALVGSGRIGRSGEGKDTRYHVVDGEE
jgi:DNA-binding transcriptional regulator PaaX